MDSALTGLDAMIARHIEGQRPDAAPLTVSQAVAQISTLRGCVAALQALPDPHSRRAWLAAEYGDAPALAAE